MTGEKPPEWKEFVWESPDGSGPFRLRLWYGKVGGRPGIVGVEMWGIDPQWQPWTEQSIPDAHIKASDVRLPLGKLLDERMARQRADARGLQAPETVARAEESWAAALAKVPLLQAQHDAAFARARAAAEEMQQQKPKRHRGRPAVPESRLREVALKYQQLYDEGSRKPAFEVWEYFDERGVKAAPETVRRWIGMARDRKYLLEGGRRKP